MKQLLLIALIGSVGLLTAADRAKDIVPRPNEPIPKAAIMKLTGDWEGAKLNRDIRILWLSGPEDHKGGEHDYIRIKDLFVPMLKTIPQVTVDEAFQFPTKAQFDQADLLIQYLHLPNLTDEQLAMFRALLIEAVASFQFTSLASSVRSNGRRNWRVASDVPGRATNRRSGASSLMIIRCILRRSIRHLPDCLNQSG